MHINVIIFCRIKHITFFTKLNCKGLQNKYRYYFDFNYFIIWNKFSDFVNVEVTNTI